MDTSAPDGRIWEVVVIGAGQAGLATAHDLARRGLVPGRDFLVLDASMGPGGAWRERWDSLSLGRAHAIADLPGLALGPADPSVPASEVVAAYFRRYEERFALSVLRPARVTAVRPTDLPARPLLVGEAGPGRAATGPDEGDPGPAALVGSRGEPDRSCSLLAVEAEVGGTGQRFLTRMVVSAAGTWTRPYIPWVPGASQFRGTQLHTVGYRRAEDFAGRRVVVVGGGLSAVQFLLELAPVAETIWATRRPPNFTDVAFDQEWGAGVERAVQQRTSGGQLPASVVRTTGIPREPAYLRAIEEGILVSRGMFDMVDARAVRFSPALSVRGADGLGPSASPGGDLVEPASWRPVATPTWEWVDVIFWNTGFRSELRHLQPLHLREPGGGIRMVGRVQVARDPRVLLVGHGSSASTLGATRAGREAARVAVARLGADARARAHWGRGRPPLRCCEWSGGRTYDGRMPRRRVDPREGMQALRAWRADPDGLPRRDLLTAVRFSLEELGELHPGRSVEVRVPPAGAVQILPGTVHRRGTPPAVVETDMGTWLELVTGDLSWEVAETQGRVQASGERAELGPYFPVVGGI